MISKINTYTFLIIATIASFFIMATFKTPTIGVTRESGWFGYIDDTALIFLVLALPFFLILVIYSLAGHSLKKTKDYYAHLSTSQKALLYLTHPLFICIQLHVKFSQLLNKIGQSKFLKYSFLLVITIGAIYFFEHTSFISWTPYSVSTNTLRNTILIVSLVLIFNYLKHTYFNKQSDFWKVEFFKFITLFFGTIFILNIADFISYSIDKNIYSTISKAPFNDSPELIIIGLALAFAIANLFNNITKKHLYKHYKI